MEDGEKASQEITSSFTFYRVGKIIFELNVLRQKSKLVEMKNECGYKEMENRRQI